MLQKQHFLLSLPILAERIALPERANTPIAPACADSVQNVAVAQTTGCSSSSVPAPLSSQQASPRVLEPQPHKPNSHEAAAAVQGKGSRGAQAALRDGAAQVAADAPGASIPAPTQHAPGGKKSKQHRQAPAGVTPPALQPFAPHASSATAAGASMVIVKSAAPAAVPAADAAASQMPAELVQELLQQHSKLLDLMQTMASTAKVQAERSSRYDQQQQQQQQAARAAAGVADAGVLAAPAVTCPAAAAQHQQYDALPAEQHQLKKRFAKVQKVLLQHLQEARLQAAAADAAREDACR